MATTTARPRRDRHRHLRRLVPDELAAAHERVRAAAAGPGIVDREGAVTVADDTLLEVAALLAGRTPMGDQQRAYVAARISYLDDLAVALEERGDAWQQAVADLDELSPEAAPPPGAPSKDGVLVTAFVFALSPFIVTWEALRTFGRAVLTIADSTERGLASTWTWICCSVRHLYRSLLTALRRWRDDRDRLRGREARARIVAARLRLRLRLRRLRTAR